MTIETFPIAPDTVTVLGYRVEAADEGWKGLDFSRAKLRSRSTAGVVFFGNDAPFDLHLDVPWCHPDDQPEGWDDDCSYRVRAQAEISKRWRGRMVNSVTIIADPSRDPPWALEIGFRP